MAIGNDVTLKVGFDIDKFQSELQKTNGILNSWQKGVATTLGGIGLGMLAKNIGGQIIDVTSQFQKFEAILTNTLGSNSEAQKAMKQIEQFAVNTPFEVSEITAAYVRWANQGLDPTIERMGKLGDVASSLGAGFEQTAEAFKDLMVGQTKRIEEVGISATQMNGKIQLSFKGVNIEIEKNAKGVQTALDVYSQLNGVLGTSEAIAATLGGKISNLADAWDIFLKKIGTGANGPLTGTITFLTELLNTFSGASKATNAIEGLAMAMNSGTTANEGYARTIKEIVSDSGLTIANSQLVEMTSGFANQNDTLLQLIPALKSMGVIITGLNKGMIGPTSGLDNSPWVADHQRKLAEATEIANKKLQERRDLIAQITRNLEIQAKFDAEKAKSVTPDGIPQGHQSIAMPDKVGSPFSLGVSQEILDQNAVSIERYAEQAEMIKSLNKSIMDSFVDLGINVVEVIGSKLGDSSVNLGKGLKVALGRFLSGIGKLFIQFGVAAKGFQELLKNITNPAAAIGLIAAGAILVGVGAAIVSSAGNGPSGGGGGSSSSAYEGRSSVNGNTQSNMKIEGELRADGSVLLAVIRNAAQDNKIRKG